MIKFFKIILESIYEGIVEAKKAKADKLNRLS